MLDDAAGDLREDSMFYFVATWTGTWNVITWNVVASHCNDSYLILCTTKLRKNLPLPLTVLIRVHESS